MTPGVTSGEGPVAPRKGAVKEEGGVPLDGVCVTSAQSTRDQCQHLRWLPPGPAGLPPFLARGHTGVLHSVSGQEERAQAEGCDRRRHPLP